MNPRRVGLLAAAMVLGVVPFARTASAAETPYRVLILGDSYSAGNGAGSYYGVDDCHRSSKTWGERLADKLETKLGRTVDVTNRACSGGVTRNVVGGTTADPREVARKLGEKDYDLNGFWETSGSDADAIAKRFCEGLPVKSPDEYWSGKAQHEFWIFYHPRCTHYVKSQLSQVDASFDLVVLTLGGNDIGFSTIGTKCLVLDILGQGRDTNQCKAALSNAESLVTRTDSGSLKDSLVRVMDSVQARLNPPTRAGERGQVMLLSYPYLIQNDDYSFDGVKVGARLKAIADRGDAIEREVMSRYSAGGAGACARKVSIFGDGSKAQFGSHGVSAPINTNGSDDWWLWQVILPDTWETLHPKPVGHAALADAAFDAVTAAGAGGCATANSFVLNRSDNGIEGMNLEETLSSVGDVVQRASQLPADLSQFRVIWVVMAYDGLSADEVDRLTAFVQAGGSLYLTGERPCCEALNASIQQVVNGAIKLPDVTVGGLGDIDGTFSPNYSAAGNIAVSPQRLIDFQPEAPGGMAGLGNVTGRNVLVSNGIVPVAGVWDEQDMTTGKGRIVVLMDIDWLKSSDRSQYAINVHEFLAR